jgi:hypothetical protein
VLLQIQERDELLAIFVNWTRVWTIRLHGLRNFEDRDQIVLRVVPSSWLGSDSSVPLTIIVEMYNLISAAMTFTYKVLSRLLSRPGALPIQFRFVHPSRR